MDLPLSWKARLGMGIALLNLVFSPFVRSHQRIHGMGFDLQRDLVLAGLYEMHAYEHELA